MKNRSLNIKCVVAVIMILIGVGIFKSGSNCRHTITEKLVNNSNDIIIDDMFSVPEKPEGCFANQGFAIYNNVLFQLYNDNRVVLSDWRDGTRISQLDIVSTHGDTIDFSNEFLNEDDEFPLAYITADTNPALIYVARITRESTSLIRTYSFQDINVTGYYAGHCLDSEKLLLYLVGYSNESYYLDENNEMIVTCWDLQSITSNEDGTITPKLIDSYTIPFIITIQGQRFYQNRLYLLSSHNGQWNIETDTKLFIVDTEKRTIVGSFDQFPESIRRTECEGIEFVTQAGSTKMILSTFDPDGGKYYILQ